MIEKELIGKILDGDKNAYKSIVEKYQPMVFRISMGFVHNREQADDISQEVFINAYLSLHKFIGNSSLSTWLYRITVNNCLNYLRNYKRQSVSHPLTRISESSDRSDEINHQDYTPDPEKDLINKQNADLLYNAIDSLPEKQRIAFVLSKYEDIPQKEIAIIMKTTEGAVEQLMQRAKMKLRKKLANIYIQ